ESREDMLATVSYVCNAGAGEAVPAANHDSLFYTGNTETKAALPTSNPDSLSYAGNTETKAALPTSNPDSLSYAGNTETEAALPTVNPDSLSYAGNTETKAALPMVNPDSLSYAGNTETKAALPTSNPDSLSYTCTSGIKLQLLHVLKGTDLAKEYNEGKFRVLSEDEYIDLLKECVKRIPDNVIIHRLTGDGDKRLLIAPLWSGNKKHVWNRIQREVLC
ncbi:MAG: hypothetical protein K5989_00675, partial [Lachnospiraceae bacterium]|nr:hypothetical protein [Lachnospiraceae bacterium]